jgi:Fe-Mn family superoxide dismutase
MAAFDYHELEPYISKQIMELHHQKHHQTYVTNLNAAEEKLANALQAGKVETTVGLQAAIKFNGGGHINRMIAMLQIRVLMCRLNLLGKSGSRFWSRR